MRLEKEMRRIQIGKEEAEPSLFEHDMILHIKETKDSTKKLSELKRELGKVAGYKTNTKINNLHIPSNNARSEKTNI